MAERKRKNYQDYYNPANYYYNNSSSAVELAPEADVHAPVTKPKRQRKPQRGTKTVIEDDRDRSVRPSVFIFIAMIAIVAAAGLSVRVNSFAALQSRANNDLRNQLQAQRTRTAELSAQAASSIDLVEVERIARARLGMSEPQIHQIRYINMPALNYTLLMQNTGTDAGPSASRAEQTGIFGILNLFRRD